MKKLNANTATPLYQQLMHYLQEDIKSGKYKRGDQIPTEAELENGFGVSRIVVRQALTQLEEMGYVIKRRGKGTFVTYPKVVEAFNANGSFTKSCEIVGITPETEIIGCYDVNRSLVPSVISEMLDTGIIYVLERLRYADNKPVIFEVDYFTEDFSFVKKVDWDHKPIMSVITAQTGLIAYAFEDVIDIYSPDSRLKQYLSLDKGEQVLRVIQRVLTNNNELIYVNIQYIRSKDYHYAVRYGG